MYGGYMKINGNSSLLQKSASSWLGWLDNSAQDPNIYASRFIFNLVAKNFIFRFQVYWHSQDLWVVYTLKKRINRRTHKKITSLKMSRHKKHKMAENVGPSYQKSSTEAERRLKRITTKPYLNMDF